jgi:hypothetical protein
LVLAGLLISGFGVLIPAAADDTPQGGEAVAAVVPAPAAVPAVPQTGAPEIKPPTAPAATEPGAAAPAQEKVEDLMARAIPAAELPEKWGFEIVAARLTAGNYMIDVRYRILDPDKASPLFDGHIHPLLIDQKTGAMFAVPTSPKIGALRTTRKPKAGSICPMFFANPGQYLAAGCKVTIAVGDIRVKDVVVQ